MFWSYTRCRVTRCEEEDPNPPHHPTPATIAEYNTHTPGLTPVQWSGAPTQAQLNPVLFARNRTNIRDANSTVFQESAQLSSKVPCKPLQKHFSRATSLQGGEKEAGSQRQDRGSWESQTATSRTLAGFCPQSTL